MQSIEKCYTKIALLLLLLLRVDKSQNYILRTHVCVICTLYTMVTLQTNKQKIKLYDNNNYYYRFLIRTRER